jgi:transcriptional regulator with XRE-family HTH domain
MGTNYRKNPMVRAVDLRDRRRREGISTDDMAELMDTANPKQISAIEIGACAITLEKAILAAYRLGGIIVELVGTGCAVVAPLKGYDPEEEPRLSRKDSNDLKPGEAAWMVLKEGREVQERIGDLQATIGRGDRKHLVELYDELICDPQYANSILAKSIERLDPSIKAEAEARHSAQSVYVKPVAPQSGRHHVFTRRQCI